MRFAGKLRLSVIFLIIVMTILMIKKGLVVFNIFIPSALEMIRNIADIIIILLILFAMINMK